jgi:two-component system sensor histidine kinase TctE
VEDLLLLARADAGERSPLVDTVELDGLALEVVDLMRARASALGRQLELGTMDPVTVRGNAVLLREAVLELLENACRHGGASAPVRLSVFQADGSAIVAVANDPGAAAGARSPGDGLGLQVVEWIASEHGGELHRAADDSRVEFRLILKAETER